MCFLLRGYACTFHGLVTSLLNRVEAIILKEENNKELLFAGSLKAGDKTKLT